MKVNNIWENQEVFVGDSGDCASDTQTLNLRGEHNGRWVYVPFVIRVAQTI